MSQFGQRSSTRLADLEEGLARKAYSTSYHDPQVQNLRGDFESIESKVATKNSVFSLNILLTALVHCVNPGIPAQKRHKPSQPTLVILEIIIAHCDGGLLAMGCDCQRHLQHFFVEILGNLR